MVIVLLGWQSAALRATLAAEAQQHLVAISQLGSMVAGPTREAEPIGRAQAALSMYLGRAAFEELQAAIQRIDDGRYGVCIACDRAISFDQLKRRAVTQRCATCSPSMTTEP